MWDVRTSRLATGPIEIPLWNRPVLNRDASQMAVRANGQTMKIIDLQSGKPIGRPLTHEAYVYDVSFGPGGLLLTHDKHGALLWSDCDTDARVR